VSEIPTLTYNRANSFFFIKNAIILNNMQLCRILLQSNNQELIKSGAYLSVRALVFNATFNNILAIS
jgi:hypothetical protein